MLSRYERRHDPAVKKIYFAMLAPTILMNLTTAIGSLADTVIIGHYLDDMSLSVVTFATPIYMIINLFSALFAVGGCIAMGIDAGKGDKNSANKAFSLSMELLAVTGLILLLAGVFFSRIITVWLGAGDDVFRLVQQYSRIVLIGAPAFVLNVGFAFFVRNDGRPTLSMAGMFISIIVDIVLNVVFVGFLGWGVAGAAWSTVAGQLVSVLIIGSHFMSSKNTLRFRLCLDMTAVRIVKNGISAALHFVYQFVTILIINHLLASMAGTSGVVIYTVVFNLSTVSLSLFEGISQTIQPMVSVYYGEQSNRRIKETMRLAFITTFIICGAVTAVLEIVPEIIPMVFGIDDAGLMQQAAVAVRIYAVSMIITTVNVVIGYYLQSTEKSYMAAVMISLRCFILFLAATLALGMIFGMNGIWAAYTVAEGLTFVICIIMMRVKRRKMSGEGTETDNYLLEEAMEENTECFVFDCGEDDFSVFKQLLSEYVKRIPQIRQDVPEKAEEYLAILEECNEGRKGNYVEVEANLQAGKIIIRDNLQHEALQDPVLGWNRYCLEWSEDK